MKTSFIMLAVVALGAGGCANRSVMLKRPTNGALDRTVTQRWAAEIRANAEHGDWLLVRSYSLVGDVIVTATRGEEFSHSVVYDAERDAVIEAVGGGIRYVPLEKFVNSNNEVMLARPRGLTAAERARAVKRARTAIGKKYDYRGLFGVEDPDRFYCSELVLWSIDPRARGLDVPLVVSPADLLEYSRTVWYSGSRADSHHILAARR